MRSGRALVSGSDGDSWLVSFSDLTLLLLFFLIFSLRVAGSTRPGHEKETVSPPTQHALPIEALVAPIRVAPQILAGWPAEGGAKRADLSAPARRGERKQPPHLSEDPLRAASNTNEAPASLASQAAAAAPPAPAIASTAAQPSSNAATGKQVEVSTAGAVRQAAEKLPLVAEFRYRKDQPPELLVTLLDTVGFASGRAELAPRGLPLLRQVHAFAVQHPQMAIEISGHTDDVPVHSPRFASNWELASARALAVAHFLLAQGGVAPCRISARGFGEYRPVASNLSPSGRARNRRVEIRFYRSDGNCAPASLTGRSRSSAVPRSVS